ncbi:MAG: hypothetical protein IT434_01345 [Phycisphaerales bacterium]|jgi:hypothetical protein|nr:hypothetical protein [Phycisphaerales bacterium]
MRRSGVVGIALGTMIAASPAAGQRGVSFTPIDGLPGDNPYRSIVQGLSGDGRVAYGTVRTVGRWEAMVWTRDQGTRSIGGLVVNDASFDGSVMVGQDGRWTQQTGWVQLPKPPGATSGFKAGGISDDGRVVVGFADRGENDQAVRWSAESGSSWLPMPPEVRNPLAKNAGADGSIISGHDDGGDGGWVTDGVTSVRLSAAIHTVMDMTPDGTTFVGERGMLTNCGYILSPELGLYEIPNMLHHQTGIAWSVTRDGKTVVGGAGYSLHTAYIWDLEHGTRSIQAMLEELGADLQGFRLTEARSISHDGTAIVGMGVNSLGFEQSWIATIPTPGTMTCPLLAMITLLRRRR